MTYPFTAPLLDLLILSIIKKEDSYGYQISQQLKNVASMKDSTLYPILKRLSDNGYVNTYDQPYQGRNRKYYQITDVGKEQKKFLTNKWKEYADAIEKIINDTEVQSSDHGEGGNGDE